MADLKITGGAALPQRAQAAQPMPAVRAAQRAFFEAALTRAGAPAPTARQAQEPPQASRPASASTAAASAPQPDRLMRPGSFLDIKV